MFGILEHMGDRPVFRDGEYGAVVPVRPAADPDALVSHCLRGHDLRIGGVTRSTHVLYNARLLRCLLCLKIGDERASWCLVNPAAQVDAPSLGLTLVATPPAVRGGIARIALHLNQPSVADLDVAYCGPCERVCLEQIRVDESYRRLGFGRLLLAAALARLSPERFCWSTTAIQDTLPARSFWASVPFPGELGVPHYCSDMRQQRGEAPDTV